MYLSLEVWTFLSCFQYFNALHMHFTPGIVDVCGKETRVCPPVSHCISSVFYVIKSLFSFFFSPSFNSWLFFFFFKSATLSVFRLWCFWTMAGQCNPYAQVWRLVQLIWKLTRLLISAGLLEINMTVEEQEEKHAALHPRCVCVCVWKAIGVNQCAWPLLILGHYVVDEWRAWDSVRLQPALLIKSLSRDTHAHTCTHQVVFICWRSTLKDFQHMPVLSVCTL